jgi:peptidyl-prolyl cis-trans isomerase C
VKPQLERFVVRKAQMDLVNKLRAEAKIERLDKPAQPPAQAPQQPAQPPAPAQQPQVKPK